MIDGETIAYQYDSLNRLISAAGNGWSQTMTYDGFGNLIARAGAQQMNTPADPNTNRLTGYSYDANGNQLSNSATYDAENRIVQANSGLIMYGYDAQNKRIWQGTCTLGFNCAQGVINVDTVTMFGADGRQAGTFSPQVTWTNNSQQVAITFVVVSRRAYFGGKLVAQWNGSYMQSAVQDRLGSVGKYYPYGEDRTGNPPNDTVKFATYTRDSGTGLDYADQRYYASTFGRFMTPDPLSGSAQDPSTWNRYSYTVSDPINLLDPTGLVPCGGQISQSGAVFTADVYDCIGFLPPPTIIGGFPPDGFLYNTAVQIQNAIGALDPVQMAKDIRKGLCNSLPDARVITVGFDAGVIDPAGISFSLIINCRSGEISLSGAVSFEDVGIGTGGGISVTGGYAWNIGPDNNQIAGINTTAQATEPVIGPFGATIAAGANAPSFGNVSVDLSKGFVLVAGISISLASIAEIPQGGVGGSGTFFVQDIGNISSSANAFLFPLDVPIYGVKRTTCD